MARSGGIAAALLLCAACGAPPAPDPSIFWSVDTLARRGDPGVVPSGATLRLLSTPYASGIAQQKSGNTGLTIFPAFSEGKTAAYMTTEMWQNFDKVWVQPLYVPLAGGPPGTKPVFGLDATTRFYSPFWHIFYYTPPAGKVLKSAKEVLDSGVALTPGQGKFCAITRDKTLTAAVAEGALGPVRPLTGEPVIYDPAGPAPQLNGAAYAEGEDVWFVDLGLNRFTWDPQTLVVDETPLFTFTRADGAPLDLPKVGGTGPWHRPACDGHGTCGGVIITRPQFGALWRIWSVSLPTDDPKSGVDVYVPGAQPNLRESVQAQGFAATPPALDDRKFTLRVALDGKTCFPAGNLANCKWLDSQNAIEELLPAWRAERTGMLVSCPLVLFNGALVGP